MVQLMKEKFVTVGKHQIRYLESGDSKKTLVLVHGLGASGDRWARVIPLFAKNFHVVAPDLIGFGRSDKPSEDYTLEFFSNFLNDFFEHTGISDMFMIGSSMGGQIAAVYAVAHPQAIEKLVLVSPAGFMTKSTAALDAYVMAALYPNRDMAAHAFDLMDGSDIPVDRAIADDFVIRMKQHNAKFAFMSTLLGLQNSKLTRSDLQAITAPTMLVWGSDDPVIPISHAENFTVSIPNCQFLTMGGLGHTPYVQDPEAFAKLVLGFFGGRDASRSSP